MVFIITQHIKDSLELDDEHYNLKDKVKSLLEKSHLLESQKREIISNASWKKKLVLKSSKKMGLPYEFASS